MRQIVWCPVQLLHFTSSPFSLKVSSVCSALKLWVTKGWKKVSRWQHNKQEPVPGEVLLSISPFFFFSGTFCLLSSLSELKLLIHLWLLRCGGRVRKNTFFFFYFLLGPPTVHQWSPASQLRSSSSVGRPQPFWQIAESKDLEEVRKSIMCVHLCFSLKQTPTAPSEQRGLAGISFSIWQARLITALLYNATHVATHRCWLSLFPCAGECTGHGREGARQRKRNTAVTPPHALHTAIQGGEEKKREGRIQRYRERFGLLWIGCGCAVRRTDKRLVRLHVPSRLCFHLNIHWADTGFSRHRL